MNQLNFLYECLKDEDINILDLQYLEPCDIYNMALCDVFENCHFIEYTVKGNKKGKFTKRRILWNLYKTLTEELDLEPTLRWNTTTNAQLEEELDLLTDLSMKTREWHNFVREINLKLDEIAKELADDLYEHSS